MIFPERLSQELSNLPGIQAHKKFYPLRVQNSNKSIDAKLSAVGVHFFENHQEKYFILIERAEYDGHHSKQIAFPGGKMDPFDKSLEETAKRESIEEINIDMNNAELIGQITPVFIPVSNFEVYPFIFWHHSKPNYEINSNEVNDIITVNCKELLSNDNLTYLDIQISKNNLIKNVPCFILENKIVWGATALILSEVKELLKRF